MPATRDSPSWVSFLTERSLTLCSCLTTCLVSFALPLTTDPTTDGPPYCLCQVALAAANKIGAVVDAIIVGECPDGDLRRIVAATGGQCYRIRDLGAGFELLESEAVVSMRARRGGADKPPFVPREAVEFETIEQVCVVV